MMPHNGVYAGLVRPSQLVGQMSVSPGLAIGVIVVGVVVVAGVVSFVAYVIGASILVAIGVGVAAAALSAYAVVKQ